MSVQDCIAKFADLTLRCDVREHHSHTVTRFVLGLRSKIMRDMIIDSYDLDTVEEAFDVTLNIDLTFKRLVNVKSACFKCEGYEHYDYQCPSNSRRVSIISNDDVDDSKVVEDVHVPSKTTSIIEDISIGFDTPIFDEDHASYKGTSVVDEIVESGILLNINVHVHDTSDSAPEIMKPSVSSQILKYSFVTPLIKDDSGHKRIDYNVVTSSGPSESHRVDYGFIVIPTGSSSSESSEFLVMIQHVISSAFSFTDCL